MLRESGLNCTIFLIWLPHCERVVCGSVGGSGQFRDGLIPAIALFVEVACSTCLCEFSPVMGWHPGQAVRCLELFPCIGSRPTHDPASALLLWKVDLFIPMLSRGYFSETTIHYHSINNMAFPTR